MTQETPILAIQITMFSGPPFLHHVGALHLGLEPLRGPGHAGWSSWRASCLDHLGSINWWLMVNKWLIYGSYMAKIWLRYG